MDSGIEIALVNYMNATPLNSRSLNLQHTVGQGILISGILLIITLFVLPLTSSVIDLLIGLNLLLSIFILISVVNKSDPLESSSFPSLLLILTLFRLGININSTRSIIGQGQAGKLIYFFGITLTQNNLIVGTIVFLVVAIIQFIVISKGSERVAEVAARFTLDGLPGKQMAIDADLRAGQITNLEAQERRSRVIQESRFYGSMDGALKFVKGDVMAGFLITAINFIGGFFVGLWHHHLSLSQAISKYTLLTIGDGLANQIPSLILAFTAGLIVTRNAPAKNSKNLGSDFGNEFLDQTNLFILFGFSCFVLAIIPQFPTGAFILLGSTSWGVACIFKMNKNRLIAKASDIQRHLITSAEEAPFILEVNQSLFNSILDHDDWKRCWNQMLPKLCKHIGDHLGIQIPIPKIQANSNLPAFRYRILIYGIPLDEGFVTPEQWISPQTQATSSTLETIHGSMIELENAHESDKSKSFSPQEYLLKQLGKSIVQQAHNFLGTQEVRHLLEAMEQRYPDLVKDVFPKKLNIQKSKDILQRLLKEGISMRHLKLILEALASIDTDGKHSVDLTEMVRQKISRLIAHRYADQNNEIHAFALDPIIENKIENSIQFSHGDYYLSLSPSDHQTITDTIKETLKSHSNDFKQSIIITQASIRCFLKKIIESEIPGTVVLSYSELSGNIKLKLKDTISIGENN